MNSQPSRILDRAIEQAAQRYGHVLDPMPEGYHLVDFNWCVLYLNAMAECNGRKAAAEVLGQNVIDSYPELASNRMWTLAQRAMIERVQVSEELEYVFGDGQSGWFCLTCYPVEEGLLVKNADISEKVWARNTLEERASMLLDTQRIGRIGSFILHYESKQLEWSPEVYRIYGLDPATPIDIDTGSGAIYPEDQSRVAEYIQRCHSGETPEPIAYRIRRPDGEVRWVEARGEFELDSDDRLLRLVGIVQDITERYNSEQALRERENQLRLTTERLEMAVDAGHVGLWEWDLGSNRVYYSDQWKLQLGHEPDEIGEAFSEFFDRIHEEDQKRVLDRIQKYLDGKEAQFNIELRLYHKDGSFRHVVAQATEIRNSQGERVKLIGSQIDVTEWVELQQQFLQSQKMESLGRLAGGVAHDFNNLLTVILGVTDLTLNQLDGDSPLRTNLESIQRAGVRASGLTRQLLTFSRRQIMKMQDVDLDGIIRDMESMLKRLIGENVSLEYRSHKQLGAIRFDAGQIEQIIMNLSVNAADAMPDGGTLRIETDSVMLNDTAAAELSLLPGPYAKLTVSDTGTGIALETLDRIFEPFFSTKPAEQGTGLGLATVYGITKQAGGNARVSSELGKGSTFTIYLPMSKEEAVTQTLEPVRPIARGQETILVVEDEPSVLQLSAQVLEASGYKVIAAQSVEQAREALSNQDIEVNLLLTDVVMPELSGRELAAQIKTGLPTIKVLYMSGYTDDVILRNGISEETVSFIAKPFTAIELTHKIREVLDGGAPNQATL